MKVNSEQDKRLELSKTNFVKTINGNMKILNNLVNDYTKNHHDLIHHQLNMPNASVGTFPHSPFLPSDQYSLKSVHSVIDDLPSATRAPTGAMEAKSKKDDVVNTEAFIIHSDHLKEA